MWWGVALVVMLCGGCRASHGALRIVSDEPSLISYIETFNAHNPRLHAEFSYVENVDVRARGALRLFDLFISRNLTVGDGPDYFSSLNGLWRSSGIDEHDFYDTIVATGREGRHQYLFPLSFNIPVIVFRAQEGVEYGFESDTVVGLGELRDIAAEHNVMHDNRYTAMGFSPRWNRDFLYLVTRLHGADYTYTGEVSPIWNEEKIFQALDFMRSWIELHNGGFEREARFSARYIREPHYRPLMDKSVSFIYMDAVSFYNVSLPERQLLDYRILRGPQGIPVLEGVLNAALSKRSPNRRAAQAFVRWIADADNQKLLLERSHHLRIESFGFAGGFSTRKDINQLSLPTYYPHLLGRIPNEELLVAARYPISNWNVIRDRVVERWLLNDLAGVDQRSLAREVELWQLNEE